MPKRLIVVDWGVGSAVVSEYHQKDSEDLCLESFQIEWATDSEFDGVAVGHLLSQELRARGISTREVVASVPRRFVVVKSISLPTQLDGDIAEAVYLQCENLFPIPRSELAIDFLEHSATSEGGPQLAFVAAVPSTVYGQLYDTLRSAGLKPLSIGVPELGLSSLSNNGLIHPEQIDVLVGSTKVEFVHSRKGAPIACYSVSPTTGTQDPYGYFAATMDRLMQSRGPTTLEHTRSANVPVNVYGMVSEEFKQYVRRISGIDVSFYNQPAVAQVRDLALLRSYRKNTRSIDLLNPRRCIDPNERQRRMTLLLAAIPVLVFLYVGASSWLTYHSIENKLEIAQRDHSRLEAEVNRIGSVEKTWKQLAAFTRSRKDYASEIRAMLERFRTAEQMIVASIEVNDNPSAQGSLMRLTGKVKNREVFTELTEELLAAPKHYRMRPPVLEPIRGDDQYEFDFSFELEINSIEVQEGTT